MPVAFDGDREAYRIWRVYRLTPWQGVESWFPVHGALKLSLNSFFDGFVAKSEDPLWGEPLRLAIHWYIEANLNAGSIEGATILAQTGLELLAWLHQVEDGSTRTTSNERFDHLSAGSKIRLLLGALQIPETIPPEMSGLALAAKTLSPATADGPGIITKLRNSIVHPDLANRQRVSGTPVDLRIAVRTLSLYYLELALLAVCGYQGLYSKRYAADYAAALATFP